jgi:hypothetical protein
MLLERIIMVTLTPEQQQLLQACGDEPLRLVDPVSNQEYVLLSADMYQRLQALQGDIEPRAMYPLLHRTLRDEGWDDPLMDEYNRYG